MRTSSLSNWHHDQFIPNSDQKQNRDIKSKIKVCHDREGSTFTTCNSLFPRPTFNDKDLKEWGCQNIVRLGLEWRKGAIRT